MPGDGSLDFDADELAMLRQLFRSEAHDALEAVTARLLAGGSARPSADAGAEMMGATHTLKGAAGTVGLQAMVDLTHRLEGAFAAAGKQPGHWTPATADQLIEIIDALRGSLDHMSEPSAADRAKAIRAQLDQLTRPGEARRRADSPGWISESQADLPLPVIE